MSYGPTDTGVSKIAAFVAMDAQVFDTNVSKVTAFVAMDGPGYNTNVSKVAAFVAMDQATGPTPVDQLPAVQRAYTLFAQHQLQPFAGRTQRRAAPVSSAPPPSGSVLPFERSPYLTFENPPPFPGRAPRRLGRALPPPIPSIGVPAGRQRSQRSYIAFFDTPVYEGRRLGRFYDTYGGGTNLPPRVTQVIAEALTAGTGGSRATQVILEALAADSAAGARASQVVLEALYQQQNPTYVRASQVVLEVLVPYTELPVIPVYPQLLGLTFDYVKRPKVSIGRGTSSSGREIAVNFWANPQWEWDLNYDTLADTDGGTSTTASDIKTLIGFFLNRQGTYGPFYFVDPDDNEVTSQPLGLGDGITTQFTFVRTYGQNSDLGDFTGTEPIGGLNASASTPVIYVGNEPQEDGFTIDTSTPYGNFVQFNTAPPPGVPVTADFSFYYFCRLKDDSTDFTKFMDKRWDLKRITIFSLKN